MTSASHQQLTVTPDEAGERLDAFIVARCSDLSRSRVKHLIDAGNVQVDGAHSKAAHKVAAGERVDVIVPSPVEPSAEPQEIPLAILYEDADCIVVDKAAGMVVHPAPGHPDGTLVNALLAHCEDLSGVGGELKAGIVHRLDVGTSGVIVAAKNDAAHKALAKQFEERTVTKIYGALVFGAMRESAGTFDAPIGRSTGDRKRISAHTAKGRAALTEWRVLERFAAASWLEIRLRTGRTHQIRVHLAEAGHPLVGDPLYGGEKKAKRFPVEALRDAAEAFPRPALHAWWLAFDHPRTGERMEFVAPLPADIQNLLKLFREHN